MGEKMKLSTSSIEPRLRLDFWRATLSDSYTPMEVRDYQAGHFEASMTVVHVGGLAVSHVESVAQTFARPKSLIRSGDCDDYVASIQLQADLSYSAGGHDGESPRGSITLYDMGEPFVSRNVDRVSGIGVHIPREMLERVLGPASKAVGLAIGQDQAIAAVICAFFRSLMEHGHLFDPVTADRISAIGVDLIAAGFAAQLAQEPRISAGAATLVYRAKVHIEDRLWDGALDTATIAAALNLSVRRLQEIFAEQELTVDSYLWERRLAKACVQLRDPAYDAVSIASIGYSVGFISASHFSRRFRRRFGMTPAEYRRSQRLGATP